MRLVLIFFALAVIAGCDSGASQPQTFPSSDAQASALEAAGDAAAGPSPSPEMIPAAPPPPAHFYEEQDGVVYSYIAAISEEDRLKGKAAGNVVSFAYLGRRDGKHALARIGNDGRILGYSYCAKPCRIITYDDGSRLAYNPESIIGAAFADALAGRLETAIEERPAMLRGSQPLATPAPLQEYAPPVEPDQQPATAATDGASNGF